MKPRIFVALTLMLSGSMVGAEQTPASPQTEDTERVLIARPAPASADLPPSLSLARSDYKIGRQDLLEIRVFDVDELDQTVRVADDGANTIAYDVQFTEPTSPREDNALIRSVARAGDVVH